MTRNDHFALQPIALLFHLSGCFSPQWVSDGGKFLYLSLFVTAVGFHRLLLILWASIVWFHGMALGLYCPYGWALKLMSWGLLCTHLELILDGYFKCVGCTCGLWAWMARELIIMGFGLIVWIWSTHRLKIHKFPPWKFDSLELDYPSQLIRIYMLQNTSSCHHLRNNLISMLCYL